MGIRRKLGIGSVVGIVGCYGLGNTDDCDGHGYDDCANTTTCVSGPSCPADAGSVTGVSGACLSCIDQSTAVAASDGIALWGCYCACSAHDPACRRRCSRAELEAGSRGAQGYNLALLTCESQCEGQDLVPVTLDGGSLLHGQGPSYCVDNVYVTAPDNVCGCPDGTSYGVCHDGSYKCRCDVPDGYAPPVSCITERTEGGSLLLFGGLNPDDSALGDTWTWDGQHWTKLDVQGPSPRAGAAMTSFHSNALLFGGETDDLWRWDGRCWSHETGPHAPNNVTGAAVAVVSQTMVLFGGDEKGEFEIQSQNTSRWNGVEWSTSVARGSPSPRTWASAATTRGVMVMFGGTYLDPDPPNFRQPDEDLDDTWLYDGTSWTHAATKRPSTRDTAAMATLNGVAVLFGGEDVSGKFLSDTWTWDGTRWTRQNVEGPSARMGASMAYFQHRLVLFGGLSHTGPLSDTWTWDGNGWTQVTVQGPSARYEAAMAAAGNPDGGVSATLDAGPDAGGPDRGVGDASRQGDHE